MGSLHSGLWEHTLFPALCVLGELLNLFLFIAALPATCMCRSVQSKIQGDSIIVLRSSLLLCGFSSHILAALASPSSHMSSLLTRLRLLSSVWGSPFQSSPWKLRLAVGWAPPGVGRATVFVSLLSGVTVLPCPVFNVRRQFYFISFIEFSSCLWQDSNLHSSYFFLGNVEVPGGF